MVFIKVNVCVEKEIWSFFYIFMVPRADEKIARPRHYVPRES